MFASVTKEGDIVLESGSVDVLTKVPFNSKLNVPVKFNSN